MMRSLGTLRCLGSFMAQKKKGKIAEEDVFNDDEARYPESTFFLIPSAGSKAEKPAWKSSWFR